VAQPTLEEKQWVKWFARNPAEADVGDRSLRSHEPIERARSAWCWHKAPNTPVFSRKACRNADAIAGSRAIIIEFDAFGDGVIENARDRTRKSIGWAFAPAGSAGSRTRLKSSHQTTDPNSD
jgi:hypothetical protein